MKTKIDWTRINNDGDGNPRYVCHFLNLLTDEEKTTYCGQIDREYEMALNRAREIGGKKFHNKQYGGGIVFSSVYSLDEMEQKIVELLENPPVRVIFRKFPAGDILALFPDLDAGNGFVQSYQHVGQHSGADYVGMIQNSKPAKPTEYRDLYNELKSIGYNMNIRQRR